MIKAKIPNNSKHIVSQKAIERATNLDGLVLITLDGHTKPQVEH